MRRFIYICWVLVSLFFVANHLFSEDKSVDRLVVPFSNPDKPGFIEASLINGGITVTGYNGKEVILEASTRTQKISEKNTDTKKEGMIRINVTTTGLSVEEADNLMEISVDSWRRTIDLNVRVPQKTSLKLYCINAGDILVENVEGEIEVNNTNGRVTLSNISGTVIAHALNKFLKVTMKKVDPNKNMSFSTLNGDIDVTFPSNLKATVKLKADNGEIFSDYKIQIDNSPRKVVEENHHQGSGKYRVKIDPMIHGTINGGGPEILFTSFNGDIFIRKAE